ncbi:MAG: hypothetical protein QGF74_03045 [Candidatus Nanoarchaeia archaeon]|nr:hypothetical protein [Candidatus Nanoarchaeia archaeon]
MFKYRKNERVLVLTDSKKLDIAEIILDESTEVAKYSKLLEKEIGTHDGEEPSKEIAKEMLNYDVIIAPTTHSISHTKAKVTGKILEDEKVMGTCHIALGSSLGFGGKVKVPIHLDGVIKKPTIFVDDEEIMRKGKFRL